MKKVVSLVLCGIIILSIILTGCSSRKDSKESEQTNPELSTKSSIVTANGTFPITEKKTSLKFFTAQPVAVENVETNEFTKEYEEKTNVHIEWTLVPSSELSNVRKLSLASSELPDVYFGANVTQEEEMTYGTTGSFVVLNELIDKYSVHLKKLMAQYPAIKASITTPSGAIYSLPLARETYVMQINKKAYFNKKWLERLSLKVPTTTEEFYQVLRAFKDKDPNGNGKNDEMPFILPDTARSSYLMCSFIYDDGDERFTIDKNNKLDVAFNKPEWRNGLEYLGKLYAEGLLDNKQTFVIKNADIKKIIDKDVIGGTLAAYGSAIADAAMEGLADYQTIPPLKGPNGVQLAAWDQYIHTPGTFVITSACKNPEIAMRWVDWLYSFDGALRGREGRENQEWKRPAPGTLSYAGIPATWERMTVVPAVQNYCYNGITFPHNMMINNQMKDDVRGKADFDQAIIYDPYKAPKTLPNLYMTAEDAQEFAKLKGDIVGFVNDSIKKYVTGASDVTKDWDAYVKNLDNLGVKRYIEIKQKYYDLFIKNNPSLK